MLVHDFNPGSIHNNTIKTIPFQILEIGLQSQQDLTLIVLTGSLNNLLDLLNETLRKSSPIFLVCLEFLILSHRKMGQND